MSRTNSEWPKEWNAVLPDEETEENTYLSNSETWIYIGTGARVYEGTFYVSSSFGNPDEDVEDEWYPFDEYVSNKIQEESKKLNEQFAQEVIPDV